MDTEPTDHRFEDALLGGSLGPHEVDAAWRPVATLVHASRAPVGPGELAAEDQTVAALLRSVRAGCQRRLSRPRKRPGILAQALSAKVAVVVMAVAGGGVATAATGAMAPVRSVILSGLSKVGLTSAPNTVPAPHHRGNVGPASGSVGGHPGSTSAGGTCGPAAVVTTTTIVPCGSTSTPADGETTTSTTNTASGPGGGSSSDTGTSPTSVTTSSPAGPGVAGTGSGSASGQGAGNGNAGNRQGRGQANGGGNGNSQGSGDAQGNGNGQGNGKGSSQGNGNGKAVGNPHGSPATSVTTTSTPNKTGKGGAHGSG